MNENLASIEVSASRAAWERQESRAFLDRLAAQDGSIFMLALAYGGSVDGLRSAARRLGGLGPRTEIYDFRCHGRHTGRVDILMTTLQQSMARLGTVTGKACPFASIVPALDMVRACSPFDEAEFRAFVTASERCLAAGTDTFRTGMDLRREGLAALWDIAGEVLLRQPDLGLVLAEPAGRRIFAAMERPAPDGGPRHWSEVALDLGMSPAVFAGNARAMGFRPTLPFDLDIDRVPPGPLDAPEVFVRAQGLIGAGLVDCLDALAAAALRACIDVSRDQTGLVARRVRTLRQTLRTEGSGGDLVALIADITSLRVVQLQAKTDKDLNSAILAAVQCAQKRANASGCREKELAGH